MCNSAVGGPGWRLVGEFTQPLGPQDEQWVVDGLTAALRGIAGLSPDLERVQNAAVAAVRRVGDCRTLLAPTGQPLRVRVLISAAIGHRLARSAWGFFVLEHTTGEVDGPDAVSDWQAARLTGHCIELYIFDDAGPA